MAEKICCVTGHRDLSEDEMELLRPRLATEVEQAVAAGFNCFLSGFAEGADLLFAEIVARMKRDNPKLRLEAAIPYRVRYARLMEQPGTRALLHACDSVAVLREAFTPDVFMARNRYMVERSERVIAVYDGRAIHKGLRPRALGRCIVSVPRPIHPRESRAPSLYGLVQATWS